MKGNTMLAKLQQLGVMPSFSRPHVSDDNAFAESVMRTVKYNPSCPIAPLPLSKPRERGSPLSSLGTTTSTSTAASASSRRRSVITGMTSRSSSIARPPTPPRRGADPIAGRATLDAGIGPPSCAQFANAFPEERQLI